jgi:FkbM family methyltransferase
MTLPALTAPKSLWRPVAERLTHRFVMCRRLPAGFGQTRIYVSSEGGLRYLAPSLRTVDPNLLRLVRELVTPGSTVWDLGANVGLFTFAAASLAGSSGRVLAIDADTWLVTLLRRSAAVNPHLAPLDILPVAVSDRVGINRFHIAQRNRSTNYLEGHGYSQAGGSRSTHLVPTVTLDWLADHFPAPDVIKIDVEGAEALVLAGGASVLAGGPTIVCEVAQANASRVRELLSPFGYALYDADLAADRRRQLDRVPAALLAIARGPANPATPAR